MNPFQSYLASYKGLSREVWMLAFITLINRAGTMVLPFLSLYLTESKGFSLSDVGWIMTFFGVGSLIGTWIGGKLTDIIGYYKVIFASIILTGVGFMLLQYVEGFWKIGWSIFAIMIIADTFRPALFVAISAYSKPENKTRSVTLIRLAINLGFAAGPAVAGLIIAKMGYDLLFWIDGITCICAGLFIFILLNPKKTTVINDVRTDNPKSVYKDKPFWIFFVAMVLYAMVFMQLFSVIPVFYRQEVQLDEQTIGLLMALNGFMIFLFEMPLVKYIEQQKKHQFSVIIVGTFFTAITYMIFIQEYTLLFAVIGMLTITLGEMIALPFTNSWAMERSTLGKPGEYMAMYSIAFSLSHIFAHNLGMQFAENYGFRLSWMVMFMVGIVCIALLYYGKNILKKEKTR